MSAPTQNTSERQRETARDSERERERENEMSACKRDRAAPRSHGEVGGEDRKRDEAAVGFIAREFVVGVRAAHGDSEREDETEVYPEVLHVAHVRVHLV